MNLEIDGSITMLLEERGIRREDIVRVLTHALETGEGFRLGASGRLLAWHRPEKITFWVEHERKGDSSRVVRAYSHRMEILHGFNMASQKKEATEWLCMKCDLLLELAVVKLTYLDETFASDLLACPSCQAVLVTEEIAMEKMALAEHMLEDK